MVLFLYTNAKCEYQATRCLLSLEPYLPQDMKIVYFTIGFESNFKMKNLETVHVLQNDSYPSFHYYKSELSLKVLDMYPKEKYFFFTDTDILFSPRIDFEKLKCDETYPLGVFGPHEYPFLWHQPSPDAEKIILNEVPLMKYLNVPERTIRYQWSCFFSFNQECRDYLEEYTSLCQNTYLCKRAQTYFPIVDETAFNVLLWKRNATKSLGFIWVNTSTLEVIKQVEENEIKDKQVGMHVSNDGVDWEYIHDSKQVMFYHGAKISEEIDRNLKYLLEVSNKKSLSIRADGKTIAVVPDGFQSITVPFQHTNGDTIQLEIAYNRNLLSKGAKPKVSSNRLDTLIKQMRLSFYDTCGGVNELYGLLDMIREHFTENFVMAEIGSFEGKSTELFAMHCNKVYSIDPYAPYAEIETEKIHQAEMMFNAMHTNYPNITKIKKASLEAVNDFEDASLDAVYIDGAHDYPNVKADLVAWKRKVKKGGIICGHDYQPGNAWIGGIVQAVNEEFPLQRVYIYKDSSFAVVNP